MKKVINGKLYNTETAKQIGCKSNSYGYGDFNYLYEALYLTKSGAYFLHGIGGANTKYAKSSGNNTWSGSERIEPMSPESARKWAEENLSAEEYENAFGEPEEASDAKVILNISVSAEFKAMLVRMREETGKSISQIIEEKFMK